jgi:hypothetical protein
MVLKCGLEQEVYRAWADAPWIIGYAVGPEVWKDLLGNWDEAMKAVTRGVIFRLLSYGENCACRRKGKFDWWGGGLCRKCVWFEGGMDAWLVGAAAVVCLANCCVA